MRFNEIRWIVLMSALNHGAYADRILAIFGFENPTQYSFVEPLLKRLVQRGHYVTTITYFSPEQSIPNLRNIVITENEILYNELLNTIIDPLDIDHFNVRGKLYSIGFKICENILGHEAVQNLMRNEAFDLIFIDVIFSESLFGFAQHFKAPIVGLSTIGTTSRTDELVGNITPQSYASINRWYSQNINLWMRCLNVALYALERLHYYYEYIAVHKEIYERYFPNATATLDDVKNNFSLVLLNDHFVIGTPRPYVPNMVEVAGLHIPETPKPLAADINEMLNSSKQGVIYVAIDKMLPDPVMQIILKQFQGLQHLVLWNSKTMPSQSLVIPSNVQFRTNISHHAILSHPLVHLLICHGGYHKVIESIYYGVPVLGIPNVRGNPEDYFDFIGKMSHGLTLRQAHFNNQTLHKALWELLFSEHYSREAKLKSLQFRDQQNTPLERATYWMEYVLRHKGAAHLRNLGQNLSTVEFYNLDVYFIFFISAIILMFIPYLTLNICLRLVKICFYKNKSKKD